MSDTGGSTWSMVINSNIGPTVAGDVNSVARSVLYLDLLQSRMLATQVQVERATIGEENAILALNSAELRRTEIENKLTINQNQLQLATQAHAAAQAQLTTALQRGAASSFELQQANAILSSTGRETYQRTLDQISLNEQLAVSNNSVQIATNNVQSSQAILNLDKQRAAVYEQAFNIALIASTINIGGQILSLTKSAAAILGRSAAMQAEARNILLDMGMTDAWTASLDANTAAQLRNAAAAGTETVALGAEAASLGAVATAETAVETAAFFGLVGLQHGGLVTRPTLAMIGEAGPEMVTPAGGGGTGGVTINMSGIIGGSASAMGDRIAYSVNRAFDRRMRSLTK